MEQTIQISWDWYIVRASGLVGFLLLYISILAGTVSCLPGIRKYFLRLNSLNLHCWISLQALIFALIHAISLIFHRFIPFSLADVFVPFHSNFERVLTAYGTIAFYLIVALVATSYLRKYISYHWWRAVHFFNLALYAFVVVHAYYLGTDLKSGAPREIFLWTNALLILLLAYNLIYRIWLKIKKREVVCEAPASTSYENIPPHQFRD